MKLRIEKWVEETKPFKESDSANELLEESVRCYKIGAYKSAFIMSYLSFKITIKYRILECSYGGEVVKSNPKIWEDEIITNLGNDDKWEKYLNDIIDASCAKGNKKDMAILHFKNEEQIKTDYNYWKNIRNDCTHAKGQITIDSSTVECFWNYMIDNLSKFYVLGGEEYLIRELKDLYEFYRYSDIVEPERVRSLLFDVSVVHKNNSEEFFKKFIQKIGKIDSGKLVSDTNLNFWKDILESDYESVRDGLVKVISNTERHFFRFSYYFPQLFDMSIALDSKFVVEKLVLWLDTNYINNFHNIEKVFWNTLVKVLEKYNGNIDINKIVTQNNIKLIKFLEPDERKLRILNNYKVFKHYIVNVSGWFFKTDSDSQYDNFKKYYSSDFDDIECCFNYLEWDIERIKEINYALQSLKTSMDGRKNFYSIMNGDNFKSRCKRIICNNKDKIKNVPNVNLSDYSYVSDILDRCSCD